MKFNLSYGMYKLLRKEYPKDLEKISEGIQRSLKALKYRFRYDQGHDEDTNKYYTDKLSSELLIKLTEVCGKNLSIKGAKGTHKILRQWQSIHKDVNAVKVTNLNQLVEAVRAYISTSPHHVMFKQNNDGHMVPYLCLGAAYHEAVQRSGYYEPAHTDVHFAYSYLGNHKDNVTVSFASGDIQLARKREKGTVKDVLEKKGYFLENETMWSEYQIELSVFNSINSNIGEQYLATGTALGSGWRSSNTNMTTRENTASKCVIDLLNEDHPENKYEKYVTTTKIPFKKEFLSGAEDSDFFIAVAGEEDMEDSIFDDEDANKDIKYNVAVPDHPYISIFNLYKHERYKIHVNNLVVYEYDETLVQKLILPDNHKNLIDMLVQGTEDIQEDIIKGKTGGIIVIATGPPGTGKTLTAEVYAEFIKAPLYVVQCSQLGIGVDSLEENLNKVLDRALRWKAILLIDEADVYVHTRGNDILQNAIVGVFLRILEYYNGVLFMTSNRETIIDDAILSRALAHIRYDKPGSKNLEKIWKVIADEFQIDITTATIKEASSKYNYISGRDVKNILKLGNLLAKRQKKKRVDMELINYVITYQDVSQEEKTK